MRSIFAAATFASLHILAAPAIADDRTETAVRLFLGIGNSSAVTAEAISSENDDVVVRNLVLPMNAGPATTASKISVREMRFVGVQAGDSEMTFKGIAGSGLLISGDEAIAARSLVMGPGKAKDLGVTAFAIDGDVNLTILDLIAPSKAGTVRVASYTLAMTGDPKGKFKQNARFDGVRSDQLRIGNASDGIQAEMAVVGDGEARVIDGTVSVKQAQFGEISAKFAMQQVDPVSDRLSLMLGYGLLAGAPQLKQATISYTPSEQIRTTLMFLSGDQRKSMVEAVVPFLRDKLGSDSDFARAAAAEVDKFLVMPVRLSVAFAPPAPVGISDVQARSAEGKASNVSLLGVSVKSGE
jgi:hypothetical protein